MGTAELTPEQLLEMVKNQPGTDSDSDDSTHDDFSSDLEDLMTDDDDDDANMSDDDDNKPRKKLTHTEWKKVARELLQEAEIQAKKAEEQTKKLEQKHGKFDDF